MSTNPPPRPSPARGEGGRRKRAAVFSGPLPPCGGGLGWGVASHCQRPWNDPGGPLRVDEAVVEWVECNELQHDSAMLVGLVELDSPYDWCLVESSWGKLALEGAQVYRS